MNAGSRLCPRAAFDAALSGHSCEVVGSAAGTVSLPAQRWLGPPDTVDHRLLLSRCTGPTLDIGCGPGRLSAALLARGTMALGIDVSAVAVRHTLGRGATALRRDVFGPVPGTGRWHHVLLADGNVGIGGEPVRLLRRSRELLRPGGTAVVELGPPGTGLRRERLRLLVGGRLSGGFDWAHVGADVAGQLAVAAGMRLHELEQLNDRWVAVLRRPGADRSEGS